MDPLGLAPRPHLAIERRDPRLPLARGTRALVTPA